MQFSIKTGSSSSAFRESSERATSERRRRSRKEAILVALKTARFTFFELRIDNFIRGAVFKASTLQEFAGFSTPVRN